VEAAHLVTTVKIRRALVVRMLPRAFSNIHSDCFRDTMVRTPLVTTTIWRPQILRFSLSFRARFICLRLARIGLMAF
jgi:hypothetical protein